MHVLYMELTRENLEFCKKHLKPAWGDGLTVEKSNEIFIELDTMIYGVIRATSSQRTRIVVELEHLKELAVLPCNESRKAYLKHVGKVITYRLHEHDGEWSRVIADSVPYMEFYSDGPVH